MGWKEFGCCGNDFVETPQFERLMVEEVRFTNFSAEGTDRTFR
ncbi:MAG: hypothetical protein GY758_15575 [Fuerstiella sp.]|nr:hypothetical protein [Fuerstiella sp.]